MPAPNGDRASRLTAVYLFWIGLGSAAIGLVNMWLANGWAIGEWLTNYSAGFIRRGLEGELILVIARGLHLSFAHVALALQLSVYFTFLACVWGLARRACWSVWTAAAFVSPATLSFILMDPPNGFKKEILLFATLAATLCLLETQPIRDWQLSLLLSAAGFLLVLSHEPLLFYLPYFAAGVVAARGRRALAILAPPAAASLTAFLLAISHPGDASMAATICGSVGGTLGVFGAYQRGLCNGSILWLGQSREQAHQFVMRAVHVYGDYGIYAPRIPLAVLPPLLAVLTMSRRGLRRQAHAVMTALLFAGLGSLFLFYVGRDWGRWIHIHAVCLMLLALALSRRDVDARMPQTAWSRGWAYTLLAVYACCWTLPAVDIYQARFGYFGVYRYLRSYGQKHPNDPAPEKSRR